MSSRDLPVKLPVGGVIVWFFPFHENKQNPRLFALNGLVAALSEAIRIKGSFLFVLIFSSQTRWVFQSNFPQELGFGAEFGGGLFGAFGFSLSPLFG